MHEINEINPPRKTRRTSGLRVRGVQRVSQRGFLEPTNTLPRIVTEVENHPSVEKNCNPRDRFQLP